MPTKIITGMIVFVLLILACNNESFTDPTSQIIPAPKSHSFSEAYFTFEDELHIEKHEKFPLSISFLESYIDLNGSVNINDSGNGPTITFVHDENVKNEEGYILDIKEDKIAIIAREDVGAFYAVQTLRQILPVGFESTSERMTQTSIRCQRIEDEPRFKYRGLHLDVGRHMYSTDFIKKYIDALAMLKMNTFHWHLTEDQGWRIEIKKYPKLNEIGAYRNETLIGHYNDQPQTFDNTKYGGYYTQEEVMDIVSYAKERHVTVTTYNEL